MNILFEYSLKTEINLTFVLTDLYYFIKDYPLQVVNYFEVENTNDSIILFGGSDNLLLDNFLITFI